MNLLHIDAGITGPGSVSRQLSAKLVEAARNAIPDLRVVRRDLDAAPVPHLDSQSVAALRGPAADDVLDREAARNAQVLQEFMDADVIVLGAPMYNLGIPSQLKAWFDRVVVAGKTFRYTAEGPQGLAGDKTVVIASARGGLYAPGTAQAASDFHEPYLKALFGFMGIEDVTIVRAEGVGLSPEHRQAALDAAIAAAPAVAATIAA